MTASATPGEAPIGSSPELVPPEFENIPSHLPSDPLVKSRVLVDADPTNGEKLAQGDHGPTEPRFSRQSPSVVPASSPVRIPSGAEPKTPASAPETAGSQAESKTRRRNPPPESWLPPGWLVEDRVRISGLTAGTVDKYYIDPASGRKFRSKNEVLYFMENGALPKKRKKTENSDVDKEARKKRKNSDVDKDTSASPGSNKNKKSGKKAKTSMNFDFVNVPEKIDWVLTDRSEASWTPFIGDEKVLESISQHWAGVFTSITTRNGGQTKF